MAGKKLQGQVAIVTGAGRGIGAATARCLARYGARVVLTARSEDEIEAVSGQIRRSGGEALAVAGDVSDLESVEEVVESALDQFNRVDILVNNAAIVWPIDEIVATDPEEWAYNIHVNLVGAMYMTHNVLPLLVEQGTGHLVIVSSGAARQPMPGFSAYCAAKAGLEMFARTLALELQGTGVMVNTLVPGMVDTAMQEDVRSVDTSESRLDLTLFHDVLAQGNLGSPDQVARAITWLAGPWSRRRSGESFRVDDAQWLQQINSDLD